MKMKQAWSGKGYLEDGKSHYVVCHDCLKMIRLNKPILGSLHFCTMEERDD